MRRWTVVGLGLVTGLPACAPSPRGEVDTPLVATDWDGLSSQSGSGPVDESMATDGSTTTEASDSSRFDVPLPNDGGPGASPGPPYLYYAVADVLVYIELDPDAPTRPAPRIAVSTVTNDPPLAVWQTAIVELEDGSLLLARGSDQGETTLYAVDDPPDDGMEVEFAILGPMIDGIVIEALHLGCDGRVYAMDTGDDETTPDGNRLLRFTGDVMAGDFSYDVVSDLATAVAADIDDMSPGIDAAGRIVDTPGSRSTPGTSTRSTTTTDPDRCWETPGGSACTRSAAHGLVTADRDYTC